MIGARFTYANGTLQSIHLTGHAPMSLWQRILKPRLREENLVCAAVSALEDSLVASILTLTGDRPSWSTRKGAFELRFEKAPGSDARLLVSSFALALDRLSKAHPSAIRVETLIVSPS